MMPGNRRRRALRRIRWSLAGSWLATTTMIALAFVGALPVLTGSRSPEVKSAPAIESSARVLLIVVDAWRLDLARDPAVMPLLHRRTEGAIGSARVQSLLPSTVAGLRGIIEGRVAAPASLLEDFGDTRASTGGLLRAIREKGGTTSVAGWRLWQDAYGPDLRQAGITADREPDDDRIVEAAIGLLQEAKDRLVIVHLGEPDSIAHRHGSNSPPYRQALREADRRIEQILSGRLPDTLAFITSDHGVTAQGGHAAREPEVTHVPLVIVDSEHLAEVNIPQTDFAHLLARAVGVNLPPAADSVPSKILPYAAIVGLAFLLALVVRQVGLLPLWLGLLLGAVRIVPNPASYAALAYLFLIGLAVCWWRNRPSLPLTRPGPRWLGSALALLALAGLLVGGPFAGACLGLGGLVVAATQLGAVPTRPVLAAIALLAGSVLFSWLQGETSSLSTLPLARPFRIYETALGLPGAAVALALIGALPHFAWTIGWAATSRRWLVSRLGRCMVLLLVGQAIVALLAVLLAGIESQTCALGISLLVRLLAETTTVFSALALLAWLRYTRRVPVLDPLPA